MKKCLLFLTLFLVCNSVLFSQIPNAFKYQAISRDEAGNPLSMCDIGLRVSLMQYGDEPTAVYVETHQLKTNIYGLISIIIGEGTKVAGELKDIKWGESRHFLKMEMDINGGEDFKEMGSSQLYAVPYALYAEEAGKIAGSENCSSQQGNSSHKPQASSSSGNRSGVANSKIPASGDSYLNIDDGNVGVGTSIPSEKLEVDGNLKVSGNINMNSLMVYDENGNPWKLNLKSDGSFEPEFSCEGNMRDHRDTSAYRIVRIGTQCWMAENLNVGSMINSSTSQSNNGVYEKYCFDNDPAYCDTNGGFYQWDEAMLYRTDNGSQGICPDGWHLPSDTEWKILEGTVDGSIGVGETQWNGLGARGVDAGFHLKSVSGWNSGGDGDDAYEYTGKPGGYWKYDNVFKSLGSSGYFWTSTETGSYAFSRYLYRASAGIYRWNEHVKAFGFSIRCLKDFICGDSITDSRDGQHYGTVKIASQCWMSQNMNVGNRLDGVIDQTANGVIQKYCYDDLEAYCDTLGGLYLWGEAMQYVTTEGAQGICPEGFHIPMDAELKALEGNVDSRYGLGHAQWDEESDRGLDAGKNLKSKSGWYSDINGIDKFGFKMFPCGMRNPSVGSFWGLSIFGDLWTSSQFSVSSAWFRNMDYLFDEVARFHGNYFNGYSVRCLQDSD